jgi:hypothetical protein
MEVGEHREKGLKGLRYDDRVQKQGDCLALLGHSCTGIFLWIQYECGGGGFVEVGKARLVLRRAHPLRSTRAFAYQSPAL